MARDAVRQRILNMYAFYNPSKLAVVKDKLRGAGGHEGDVDKKTTSDIKSKVLW
ncbi:hypothetical protein DIPPA_29539 [Diplonema papillatum]|nr:hypothetical protein DIPPA_29539 [Diplonema papillatum]